MANNQLKEEIILSTSKFDSNINSVIKKVEELKAKGSKVGDGFNTSMGSLIRVVGKFSGALGIAVSAGEAFNKLLQSSQTIADEFGATQKAATTVVDNFFQSLASGDFSPFLNGMNNIVSKAREAYNAMDDLWNMAQSFSVQNARLNNKFQQNLNEIRQKKGSNKPEDKKRVDELIKENKSIIETQAKGGAKLYGQTIKALQEKIASGTGMKSFISEDALFRIAESDITNFKGNRSRYKKGYEQYLKERAKLDRKYDKDFQNGVNYSKERNALEKKYGEYIAANYIQQRMSDEELEETLNTLKQGLRYQGAAISNQSKLTRYTKETSDTASGGKSSKGGSNKGGGTSYPVGSIGYYEDLISKLHQKIKIETDPSKLLELQNQLKEAVRLKGRLEDIGFTNRQAEVNKNIQTTGLGTLFQIPNETAEQITKELQEKIAKNPIQITIDVSLTQKRIEAIGDSLYNLGSIMQSLGGMFDDTVLDASGIIAQAVANYILGWTEATKQASLLGPIGWAAFGLSTAAQMFAVVAQIKSAGAFANGGVVGGSSYAGDNLYARVNSGEAILNTNQQKHLFTLLDGNHNQITGGNVEFVIKGSSLHGVLKNYDNKLSKIK